MAMSIMNRGPDASWLPGWVEDTRFALSAKHGYKCLPVLRQEIQSGLVNAPRLFKGVQQMYASAKIIPPLHLRNPSKTIGALFCRAPVQRG